MPESEQTLFDRIGGNDAVEALVDRFYECVLGDPILKPFFEHTDTGKLRRMQREFFAAALDGPIQYSGRPLAYVHQGRGIKPSHMGRFVGHLIETLKDSAVGEEELDGIIDRVNRYADEITGGGGLGG
jgi:hemoglobin